MLARNDHEVRFCISAGSCCVGWGLFNGHPSNSSIPFQNTKTLCPHLSGLVLDRGLSRLLYIAPSRQRQVRALRHIPGLDGQLHHFPPSTMPRTRLISWQVCFYWILDASRRRVVNLTMGVCTLVGGVGSEFVQSMVTVGFPKKPSMSCFT